MKINPVHYNFLKSYSASKASLPLKKSNLDSPDQISFSDDALCFSKVLAGVKEQFELRSPDEQARIDDIAARIAKGDYFVSPDLVADKILDSFAPFPRS